MFAAIFSVVAIGALDVARTYDGNREKGLGDERDSTCGPTMCLQQYLECGTFHKEP
jgi:hypothetical protein